MAQKHFWQHVDKSGDCWIWMGATTRGYGQTTIDKKHGYAHRFSWEFANGSIPNKKIICHKCDTPRCVNPEHLFIGTQADNIKDAIKKGRTKYKASFGSKNGNSRLTELAVKDIKKQYAGGKTLREVANAIGVSKSTVWNVVSNKNWRHVNGF